MYLGLANALLNARDFAPYQATKLFEFILAGRVVVQKRLRQAYGSDGKADHVADVAVVRDSQFATAAAEVNEKGSLVGDASVRDDTQMNEAALFQSADDFGAPASCRAHPVEECAAVA